MKYIFEIVEQNVDLEILKNYRDIDIKIGDLIVTGWNNEDSAYIVMGVYKGGHMHEMNLEIENAVVLKDISKDSTPRIKFYKEKNINMETSDWWRTPTDNEVRLYYYKYKGYDIVKHIDDTILQIENDIIDKESLIDILIYVKEFINGGE